MTNVRNRRIIAGVGTVLAFAVVSLVGPGAQAVDTETKSCNGVFSGKGSQPLVKAFVGATISGGEATLTYTLTSGRPDGESRVRDCAFVDSNGNGELDDGEALFGTDDKSADFIDGMTTISITVNAAPGDRVCDRAARSSGDYTDKSNVVCVLLPEPTTTTTSHDATTTTVHGATTTTHG